MRSLPLIVASLLSTSPAWACGQSTHVWIGRGAAPFAPPGPLESIATEHLELVTLGAMFPDAGYSPLARGEYGETAHWPGFHGAYLDWIVETYDPPYDQGEAAEHVAFLLGLTAHGMADQIFDGVYLRRAVFHDGSEQKDDLDLGTDVALTSRVGPQPIVDDVVPYDALLEVYDRIDVPADLTTVQRGVASLFIAVNYTSNAGQTDEAQVWDDTYPWTTDALLDPLTPCSPACLQGAVAAYWQTVWSRLDGTFDPDRDAIFWSWPEDGGAGVAASPDDIDSNVSVAFARAVSADSLEGRVRVVDPAGVEQDIGFGLYYGDRTNVLNVWPTDGWTEDTLYTLELMPGIEAAYGDDATSVTVSTTFYVGDELPAAGCSCSTAPGSGGGVVALLGLLGLTRRRTLVSRRQARELPAR